MKWRVFSEHTWIGQKHPKMFKFRSRVISDQFLKGHISQILEFLQILACVLMELFQDVYTEYFSEAIAKHTKSSNCASLKCISEGWVLKRRSQAYLYQSRIRFCCESYVWHNIHFLLFRFDEWDRLLRSLNNYIHIFAFPISLSVRKLWSIASH